MRLLHTIMSTAQNVSSPMCLPRNMYYIRRKLTITAWGLMDSTVRQDSLDSGVIFDTCAKSTNKFNIHSE
jgi:hypothetical protein